MGLFHPRCHHGLGTYYPELEDINGYETEDNKLNDYGSQQANEAHIENMMQRYKRLTLGSLDPDNVRKYQERLEYWENRKNELAKNENVDNDGGSGIINYKVSDHMMNMWNETDDVYSFEEIEQKLMQSDIGQMVAQYIVDNGIDVVIDYNYENPPKNIAGEISKREITVYSANNDDIDEVVSTIVHEACHKMFNWMGTQEAEINCYLMEIVHKKGTVTQQDISIIVHQIKEFYSYLPEGNLYGY